MCRLDCIIAEDKKAHLMEVLHKKGITQIEHLGDKALDDMAVSRDEPLDRVVEISNLLIRLRKIADVLSVYEPRVEKNILADMLGVDYTDKKKVSEDSYEEIIKKAKSLLDKYEDDVDILSKGIQTDASSVSSLTEKLNSYSVYSSVKEKMDDFGETKYLYSVIGTVSLSAKEAIEKKLREKTGNRFSLEIEDTPTKAIISLCARKNDKEAVETVLREANFEKAKIEGEGRIDNIIASIESDLKEYKKEEKRKREGLKKIYENAYKDILVAEELLGFEKERCEVFISCAKTKRTSITRIWVPAKQCREAEKIIKGVTDDKCHIDKETEFEDAPILLENNRVAKPFEGLTKMFALPKYNEIDPTIFIAPTFCLFFGLMLTDAIYGIVLMVAGVVTEKTMGKRSDNARAAGLIMIGTGIAAVFFGVLTGSFLGDFVAKYLMGVVPNDLAVWVDPMYGSNAMTVLVASCAMGFVHIMFGHFLGIYDKKRRGKLKTAFFEHVPWYILIAGIALVALSQTGMAGEMFMYAGGALAVAGLLLLVKGLGFMAFIDLIGLVGNTLSYARLLAMGLTTAGIAMSFNFLAGMVYQIPYIGILVAAVVFIFGHLINILINSLGAFVHSLRLQYVEHFGTYYSGGGIEFKPFRENRKHTYISK